MSKQSLFLTRMSILVLGACGSLSVGQGGTLARGWIEVSPGSATPGRELLESAARHYQTLHSYRDQGFVLTTTVGPATRSVQIQYFDTIFVREVGLRFRFYDERRTLSLAIWQRGNDVLVWRFGKVERAGSLGEASAAARGVTGFVSELAPNLLWGLPVVPTDRVLLGDALGLGGTAPGDCGRCRVVTLGSAAARRQHAFTIDERDRTLRRAQSFLVFRDEAKSGALETFETDHVIAYEPEFDIKDEGSLLHEVRLQPW